MRYLAFSKRGTEREFLSIFFLAMALLIAAGYFGAANAERFQLAVLIFAIWPVATAAIRRVNDFSGSRTPLIVWLIGSLSLFLLKPSWPLLESDFGEIVRTYVPLIWLVPTAMLLKWMLSPSTPGPNKYGPNPHEVTP